MEWQQNTEQHDKKQYKRQNINNTQWSREEKIKLIRAYNQYPGDWKRLQKEFFQNRTSNGLKQGYIDKLMKEQDSINSDNRYDSNRSENRDISQINEEEQFELDFNIYDWCMINSDIDL